MKRIINRKMDNEVSDFFFELAGQDEKAANELYRIRLYNLSIYHIIQSMEKYLKYLISKKINLKHKQIADLFAIHDIKKLIYYMIDIYVVNDINLNETLKLNLTNLLEFSKINYNKIQNDLRYPYYNKKYYVMDATREDVEHFFVYLKNLKKYLEEISKKY